MQKRIMNHTATTLYVYLQATGLPDIIADAFKNEINPAFRAYVLGLFSAFGIVGNSLCLIVFSVFGKHWHPNARTYYIALAFMDLKYVITFGLISWMGAGLIYLSQHSVGYVLDGYSDWGCKLVRYIGASAEGAQQYVLVIYGVERLVAVYKPLRVSSIFKAKVVKAAVVMVIAISYAVHGGMLRDFGLAYDPSAFYADYKSCTAVHNPQLHFKIRALFDYSIPLCCDVIINSILMSKLANVSLKRRSLVRKASIDSANLQSMKETNATVTLVVLCVVHAIILIPVSISFMLFSFQPTQSSNVLILSLVTFTLNLVIILHSVNFCVYLRQSRKFREKVVCVLLCRF